MKARTLMTPLLVVGILATACANASSTIGGGPGDGGPDHATGADDLLLRISNEGGLLSPEYTLTAMPALSLFGDGTVVTPGAQIELYPGPALPPLVATPVTEEGIQAILRAALDAGLDEDHEYTDLGAVGIADASTTVFTLTVDGATHVTKVYALGELGPQPAGMSEQEFRARTRLLDFQSSVQDLRGTLPAGSIGEDRMLSPAGLRLFVSRYRHEQGLEQRAVDWPLATPLSEFGDPAALSAYRCGAVTGAELDAVLPLASRANQLTPWRSQGVSYGIVFRPLLPDESGC
jgi:hypothetical protein